MGWSKALRRFSCSPAPNERKKERMKQPINHFSRRIGNVGIGITNNNAVDIYRLANGKREEMKNAVQFSSSNEHSGRMSIYGNSFSQHSQTHSWLALWLCFKFDLHHGSAGERKPVTPTLVRYTSIFGKHTQLTDKRMCRNDTKLFGHY